MKCPECAAASLVVETRTRVDGSLRRLRRCTGKGRHRFLTSEDVYKAKTGRPPKYKARRPDTAERNRKKG